MRKGAPATVRERKGATAKGKDGGAAVKGKESFGTVSPGSSRGDVAGGGDATVAWPGSSPRSGLGGSAIGGGVAAMASSGHGMTRGPFGSQPPSTCPSTLSQLSCNGGPPSMYGFPFDLSTWWDGGAGRSLISPPSVHPQVPDRAAWDIDSRPPGGFMSFFHNQPQQSPNFHHVGVPSHWVPFKAPQQVQNESPPVTTTSPPSTENQVDQEANESGDEAVRTDKRILWTPYEDYRLMSAWVNNSMDPISRNDKRNEQYWADVVESYDSTTPKHRKRNMKQAKDRWHKINKWTEIFHSANLKAQLIYSSGHFEKDWINIAHKFYVEDNKELKLGAFVLMEVWYAVQNEPKWVTYNKGPKNARKRKELDKEEASRDIDERPRPRPMGQKQAKKLLYEGKSAKFAIDVDELDKFCKIQADAHANRLKALEIQQKLQADKIESSKIAHLAAMEQKEAQKLKLHARMMVTYYLLLKQDQGQMSDEEKVDHVHTLNCLKKRLFPETISSWSDMRMHILKFVIISIDRIGDFIGVLFFFYDLELEILSGFTDMHMLAFALQIEVACCLRIGM